MGSQHNMELFWTLLDMREYQQLRCAVPEDFSWDGSLHPTDKTTVLIAACHLTPALNKEQEVLDAIDWLIRSGANPSQKCGSTNMEMHLCLSSDPENTKLATPYKGHSFLSWIKVWKEKLTAAKADWKQTINFLEKVIRRVAEASHEQKSARRRASVHEGIVDIWEKSLRATASHDLIIETADGEVTAHAHMLMGASPVVQAMLGSTMKEGKSRRIQVPDTGSGAVTLFLEAIYTSSALSDPDYTTVLSALDLAHRWQVEVVVSMLADLVQHMITEKSFQEIAEHAVLKNLDTLKKACQKFGTENVEIQDKIQKHQFPRAVQNLFQGRSEAPPPVKKRRSL